jgi:squalene-hopene/tetraprenyl-beta-curcumene cyclase
MIKARDFILANGVSSSRVFSPRPSWRSSANSPGSGCHPMPIELMLLPDWAYLNIYEFSSWARATIIPLSIVMAERPVRKLPPWARVQELYVRPPRATDYTFTKEDGIITWKNFFIG